MYVYLLQGEITLQIKYAAPPGAEPAKGGGSAGNYKCRWHYHF